LAILLAWDGFSQLKTETVKILEGVESIEAMQESSLECGRLASHPAIKNDSGGLYGAGMAMSLQWSGEASRLPIQPPQQLEPRRLPINF
jgi:hypothetical protein